MLEGLDSPGPPYLPPYAPVGGIPSRDPRDVGPCVTFLILFLIMALCHAGTFVRNKRKGRKFLFSMALFGFCCARFAAVVARLAWAAKPGDIYRAIAANVFILLGGVIVVIVNLFFSQRLLRSVRPDLGWRRFMNNIFWGMLSILGIALLIIIAVTVHFFFTLDPSTHYAERIVLLTCSTLLTTMAFLPLVNIGYILWVRRRVPEGDIDEFGEGTTGRKVAVLAFGSFLTTLGAGFRLGANFDPRMIRDPAWYHSRAAFYIFNFTIEFLIVFGYFVFRVDKLFHVPDGARDGYGWRAIVQQPAEADPGGPRDEENPPPPAENRPAPPAEDVPNAPNQQAGIALEDMDPERAGKRATQADVLSVPSGTPNSPGQSSAPPLDTGTGSVAATVAESSAQASSSGQGQASPPRGVTQAIDFAHFGGSLAPELPPRLGNPLNGTGPARAGTSAGTAGTVAAVGTADDAGNTTQLTNGQYQVRSTHSV